MVKEIADMSSQQATNNAQVVQALAEIAKTAEETASSSEEASSSTEEQTSAMEEMSASAQELSLMANDLLEMVGRFQVASGDRRGMVGSPTGERPTGVVPTRAAVSALASRRTSDRPAALLQPVGAGATSARPGKSDKDTRPRGSNGRRVR